MKDDAVAPNCNAAQKIPHFGPKAHALHRPLSQARRRATSSIAARQLPLLALEGGR